MKSPSEIKGSQLCAVTARLAEATHKAHKKYSISAPRDSFLWSMRDMLALTAVYDVFAVVINSRDYHSS